MATDKEFFDAESPVGGEPRRESIKDALSYIPEFSGMLLAAMRNDDLAAARRNFAEIKGWVDAIDDDLCDRDEDGCRKD